MAVQYGYPAPASATFEEVTAVVRAVRRWGRSAAVRVEDVQSGPAVFRGRYRVGHLKAGFVGATTPFFIEHGAGDTWDLAFADADLKERRP